MHPKSATRGACKTCGALCGPGQSHCGEHLLALARYVQDDLPEPDAPDVYVPRLNGVRGLSQGGTARARRGMRRPRTGEELNFDGE